MLKSIFKNSIVVTGLTILQFSVMFITQITLARLIEPQIFGVFAIITVVAMFFHTLSSLNTDKYIIREQTEIEKKIDVTFTVELLWSSIVFIIAILVIPFAILLIDKPDILIYCQVYVLTCLSSPFVKLKSLLEKDGKFISSSLPIVFSTVVSSLIAIVMAHNDYTLWALVTWRILSYVLEGLIIYIIIDYKPKLCFDKTIIKESQRFSYPLTISLVVSYIYSNVDYIIIDSILDINAVGYYWLAYQTTHFFLAIRGSINKVFYPALSKITKKSNKNRLFEDINSLTSIVYLIPVIIIFNMGNLFVVYVYGEEWADSVILFKVFILVVLFKAVASSAGPLLHTYKNTHNDLEVALINLFLLPFTVFFMVNFFGVIGAALGIGIISSLSGFYVYQRYVKDITGKGYFAYFGKPIIICLIVFLWDYFFYQESFLISILYILFEFLFIAFLYKDLLIRLFVEIFKEKMA